eukprot:3916760-Prymnesium_polylepis.1
MSASLSSQLRASAESSTPTCALGSGLHHAACSCRPRRVANDLQHVQTQGFNVVELVGADVPSIEVEVAGVSTRGVRRDSQAGPREQWRATRR